MKHQLNPGLHVAIVTNPQGGCGGSMFAWEAYATCKLSGISAIFATFDHQHAYPNIGSDINILTLPDDVTPEFEQPQTRTPLMQVVVEACNEQKFLIMDLQACFDSKQSVLNAIQDSGILQATSIAALMPILPGQPRAMHAAFIAGAIRGIGFLFDRGLLRLFDFRSGMMTPDLHGFPQFPVWITASLSHRAVEMIHQGVGVWSTDEPYIYQLPGQNEAQYRLGYPAKDWSPLNESIAHLKDARRTIFDAILAPITNPM